MFNVKNLAVSPKLLSDTVVTLTFVLIGEEEVLKTNLIIWGSATANTLVACS